MITLFIASAIALGSGTSFAMDARIRASLERLDPQERLEQRCDVEAMDRIGKEAKSYRPDRVVAYALADPVIDGDTMTAPGAAFRSKGAWYALSFTCSADRDHLVVRAFDYRIGHEIPQREWSAHALWP